MRLRQIVSLGLMLVAMVITSGCVALVVGAAVGAGTVAYVGGELKATDEVAFDRAWSATLKAMDDLQFKVTKQQKDALEGLLVARRADDTPVTVRVRKQGEKTTEIRIRVGTFGNETLSRTIHDKIKSHYALF